MPRSMSWLNAGPVVRRLRKKVHDALVAWHTNPSARFPMTPPMMDGTRRLALSLSGASSALPAAAAMIESDTGSMCRRFVPSRFRSGATRLAWRRALRVRLSLATVGSPAGADGL